MTEMCLFLYDCEHKIHEIIVCFIKSMTSVTWACFGGINIIGICLGTELKA